jgi:glycosyltransferase involved in cell wall biosynthesis
VNIIIIHYHLKPGGVTRVISSQVAALREAVPEANIRILASSLPGQGPILGAQTITCKALDYFYPKDVESEYSYRYQMLKDSLSQYVSDKDIIHVHNLNLGKNPILTMAIREMAETGQCIFNHCHDFPEDRPENLAFLKKVITEHSERPFKDTLYPKCDNFVYGVLNSHDKDRLHSSGIPKKRINLIPNPVGFPDVPEKGDKEASRKKICKKLGIDSKLSLFVYPVRAIGRKNIGEFILFSVLFKDIATWVITRSPKNPVERKLYEEWKEFAESVKANIHFEVGEKAPFEDIMHASDRIVTTSIREGFGMAFLEPWLFEKPVVGRNIPYVTCDFIDNGIELSGLYDSLPIETNGKQMDFPDTDISTQMEFIKKLKTKKRKEEFLKRTGVDDKLFMNISPETIAGNREIIEEKYSVKEYGKKLRNIYQKLSAKR